MGSLDAFRAGSLDAKTLQSVRDRIVADGDRLGRDEVASVRVIGVEDGLAFAFAPIGGRNLAVADAETARATSAYISSGKKSS